MKLLLLLLITFNLQAQSGYNLYAIDKLSEGDRALLAEVLPKGLDYRLGGEEYEHTDFSFISDLVSWLGAVEGSVSLVAPADYRHIPEAVSRLNASTEVTFKNEIWFDFDKWEYVRRDFWTYILNRQSYYRKLSKRYVEDAKRFEQETGLTAVLNVPLPKNNKFRWMLHEIAKYWDGPVSIHVYGDPDDGYKARLNGWIVLMPFADIRCYEMCGVDLRRWPNLKNSLIMADRHREILEVFELHDIIDILYFTLVYNKNMGNWQNRPVYPRYYIDGVVIDELTNVMD